MTPISEAKLEPGQEIVLDCLRLGKSLAEAARTAGVGRSSVYRWLKGDGQFVAAYNVWREEMYESCRSRLVGLTDKATKAMEKALDAGDARTALQLLKGLGMIRPEKEARLIEPEEVRRMLAVEDRKRRTQLEKAERKVELDDQSSRMLDGEVGEMVKGWKK